MMMSRFIQAANDRERANSCVRNVTINRRLSKRGRRLHTARAAPAHRARGPATKLLPKELRRFPAALRPKLAHSPALRVSIAQRQHKSSTALFPTADLPAV